MTAPYNYPRLIAELDGCEGTVQTRVGSRGLRVYTGAGTAYDVRGTLAGIDTVYQFTETVSGYWRRIQYGNDFGWVITDAIDSDCNFLPIVADDTPEQIGLRVIAPDAREQSLLRPFFGTRDTDPFFFPNSRFEFGVDVE